MVKRILFTTSVAIIVAIAALARTQEPREGFYVHTVQWYEYLEGIAESYGVPVSVIVEINGLPEAKVKTRQVLYIPKSEKYYPEKHEEVTEKADSCAMRNDVADSCATQDSIADSLEQVRIYTVPERVKNIRMGLLLPFSNDKCFEFYNGVLMAAKEAGNSGINIRLNVFDYDNGIDRDALEECNFILGPIRYEDVRTVADTLARDKLIISPLDTKVDSLCESHPNVIQVVASSFAQWKEATLWNEDSPLPEKWIIISAEGDKTVLSDAETALRDKDIEYTVTACSASGDVDEWENIYDDEHDFRVLLARSNEAALNNAIRNMGIAAMKGNVTVYCSGKVRTAGIPVENIHKAGVHALCSFYADYSSKAVKDFIRAYKSHFNCEPTEYAFHGYDLAFYLLKTYSKYGRAWKHCVCRDDRFDMLQTSFLFRNTDNGTTANYGVRRVLYSNDWKVELVESGKKFNR